MEERPAIRPVAAPDAPTPRPAEGDTTRGLVFAVIAYLQWGVLPFYMKAVAHIPATEVLAHRIIVGPNARIKDISSSSIIHSILNTVPVPGATVGARF